MEIEVRLLDFQVSRPSLYVRLWVLVCIEGPVVLTRFSFLGCFEAGGWVGWW